MSLPSFPLSVPCPGAPFAPRGPLGRVPPLHRYNDALRLLAAHLAALRCLRLAIPPQFSGRRRRGLPGSWGTLPCVPCSSTPAGPSCQTIGRSALLLQHDGVAFRSYEGVGSRDYFISRLNDTAHTLAVYASQPRSPVSHARLAPGWWSSLAGRDLNPLGPAVKFQPSFLHGVLLTQASPGAPQVHQRPSGLTRRSCSSSRPPPPGG